MAKTMNISLSESVAVLMVYICSSIILKYFYAEICLFLSVKVVIDVKFHRLV